MLHANNGAGSEPQGLFSVFLTWTDLMLVFKPTFLIAYPKTVHQELVKGLSRSDVLRKAFIK